MERRMERSAPREVHACCTYFHEDSASRERSLGAAFVELPWTPCEKPYAHGSSTLDDQSAVASPAPPPSPPSEPPSAAPPSANVALRVWAAWRCAATVARVVCKKVFSAAFWALGIRI